MPYLYCYKMVWDTEFAPNPHYGVLTLATCKPVIRRCAKVGDWISGWTANEVRDKNFIIHNFKDAQKLVYLAKIEKKMTFAEYWDAYPEKRPTQRIEREVKSQSNKRCGCIIISSPDDVYNCGDNIYEPLGDSPQGIDDYRQHPNNNHTEADKKRDISGEYVLICKEFYYFGVGNPLKNNKEIFPYKVPRCKKIPYDECKKFIETIQSQYKHQMGIIPSKA